MADSEIPGEDTQDELEETKEVREVEERDRRTTMGEINVTDSQVMIQLREAEDEAEQIRKDIAKIKEAIAEYEGREELTEEDSEALQELQTLLMDKLADLERLTGKIAYLMELSEKKAVEEIVEDEDEEVEGFADDLLPRVVVCSSWDDMMPKIVVCVDMKKKPTKMNGERDESGLTPEQREALERERRCMAEERERLQFQVATLEGEMRVMMRENDTLSRKITQLKQEANANPPFEVEMTVSATQNRQRGRPKGDVDFGFGVAGPGQNENFEMGTTIGPGAQVFGKMQMGGGGANVGCSPLPPGVSFPGCPIPNGLSQPCSGPYGIPGKNIPCPAIPAGMQGFPNMPGNIPGMSEILPDGKKCRKQFLTQQGWGACPGGIGGNQPSVAPMPPGGMPGGCPISAFGMPGQGTVCKREMMQALLAQQASQPPPMDLNFKVSVGRIPAQQRNGTGGSPRTSIDRNAGNIEQQLREIEYEVKRMQQDLERAKRDKQTLRAQQQMLTCAKNDVTRL